MSRHEVIVVGGGHNGLVCAAYLARAGVDVAVVEAREGVGGCASTVTALDGARVSICNCDHSLVRATGIIEELGLDVTYQEMDPALTALGWDGARPWLSFASRERTLQSLALTHPGQVGGYRRYLDELGPAARLVLELTRGAPTPQAVGRAVAGARGRGARQLLRLSRSSAADVLRGYFSSEALLGPVSLTGPAVWGLTPQTPGTGLGALGYLLQHLAPRARPVGGSGALTDAIAGVLLRAGGTVRTGARVSGVRTVDGRVAGVTLEDGSRLDAPIVVSAIDPRTLLVDLLDRPQPVAAAARDGYESKLDAVIDVVPRFDGLDDAYLERVGVDPGTVMGPTAVVAPTLDGIAEARVAADAGRVSGRPLFMTNVPSLLDPSLAPPEGGHVFSLEVLFTPYALEGGWAGSGEPERWLERYATLVQPGFLDGVRRMRLVGPEEYERDFGMPRGYAPSFAGGPLAALSGRDRGLTRYETRVPGLYLSGAGTFPGAGVSGAPGRNAAAVVLRRVRPGVRSRARSTGR